MQMSAAEEVRDADDAKHCQCNAFDLRVRCQCSSPCVNTNVHCGPLTSFPLKHTLHVQVELSSVRSRAKCISSLRNEEPAMKCTHGVDGEFYAALIVMHLLSQAMQSTWHPECFCCEMCHKVNMCSQYLQVCNVQ